MTKPVHIVEAKGRIIRDGNAWCAMGAGFVDPVVSPFGCGDTPEQAYDRWRERALQDPDWKWHSLPSIDEFEIEV